jgi:2-polyprenyl-3-methyl-5-hydroxy-6-metoxy-1,4-benzoquinol methylase
MALERINPFAREDRFCLDHIARYAWARPLVEGASVADVACGLGFGSALLAYANAARVTGVDLDAESVEACRGWWRHPQLEFRAGRIEELAAVLDRPCERVVCFETLEHLAEPEHALAAIRAALTPDGVLIGSVPGETDWAEDNAFHLQFFNPDRLQRMLGKYFSSVRLFRQRFHLASLIERTEGPAADALVPDSPPGLRMDFGRAAPAGDTYLFMAANAELPAAPERQLTFSRQAWLEFSSEAFKGWRELQHLSDQHRELFDRYRVLFAEHGDLQCKFTNMLGWGQYHYDIATGKKPEQHYMEAIEQAQSQRERDLRELVRELQAENEQLRAQLREAPSSAPAGDPDARRQAFLAGLKGAPPPAK